jgi:hypothetical protein
MVRVIMDMQAGMRLAGAVDMLVGTVLAHEIARLGVTVTDVVTEFPDCRVTLQAIDLFVGRIDCLD